MISIFCKKKFFDEGGLTVLVALLICGNNKNILNVLRDYAESIKITVVDYFL